MLDTLSSRDSDRAGAIQRLTVALMRRDRSAVTADLKQMKTCVVEPMDTVSEAAMWKDGLVHTQTARHTLRRHMGHHRAVMALSDGHIPFHIGADKCDKGDGEK